MQDEAVLGTLCRAHTAALQQGGRTLCVLKGYSDCFRHGSERLSEGAEGCECE